MVTENTTYNWTIDACEHRNNHINDLEEIFSLNVVVDRFIFKSNLNTLLPNFTISPKSGVGLSKTTVSFHCLLR